MRLLTVKRIKLALALLIILPFALWSIRIVRTVVSLQSHLGQLEAMVETPGSVNLGQACNQIQNIHDDVNTLRRQVYGPLQVTSSLLGWLPRIGGDIQATPHILATGERLTEVGATACEAMRPALKTLEEDGIPDNLDNLSLGQIAHILEQSNLKEALPAVEEAQEAWEQIDQTVLSSWLAERAALLEQGLPLLETGLKASPIAVDLMGMEKPRTYLILAVNEEELRPGGGFISGVGEVHIKAGQIITMTFRDSYAVDDFSKPYPYPPKPIQRYMGIDQWVFRDSNWSPDFPTAAQQAIELYRPGYPITINGVVAVDQHAVQAIAEAIGPLSIEGANDPITGDTLVSYMREAWAPDSGDIRDWEWGQRKAFMGVIAKSVWQKVQSGNVDWIDLLSTSLDLLEKKHLLIYFTDSQAANLMAERGWSGALHRGEGDFLMVVDANVGYNKANVNVQRSITYEVDLHTSPPQGKLTLVYTHTSQVKTPCDPEPRYDPTYEQMIERCYWHYLRIYTPENSQLLDATKTSIPNNLLQFGGPVSGEIEVHPAAEGPWTVMGIMSLLPLGETRSRYLHWKIPSDLIQWNGNRGKYSLMIQKQPGTPGSDLKIRVRLPQNSLLTDAEPEPSMKREEQVVYHTTLDRNRQITLQFRRPR